MTSQPYDNYSETRTYNSLLQLTRMTVSGVMDMQYTYTAGQNNGRISQSTDYISGETVVYTYDTLNRLVRAENNEQRVGEYLYVRWVRQPDEQEPGAG